MYLDGRPGDAAPKSVPTMAAVALVVVPMPALATPVPHADLSPHSSLDVAATDDFRFDRPSLTKNASYVYATVLFVATGGAIGIGR